MFYFRKWPSIASYTYLVHTIIEEIKLRITDGNMQQPPHRIPLSAALVAEGVGMTVLGIQHVHIIRIYEVL